MPFTKTNMWAWPCGNRLMGDSNSLLRKNTLPPFPSSCKSFFSRLMAVAVFLTLVSPPRFLLSTHYSHYDFPSFMINVASLIVVLIAKLPIMHKVRIFGINKGFVEWHYSSGSPLLWIQFSFLSLSHRCPYSHIGCTFLLLHSINPNPSIAIMHDSWRFHYTLHWK